MLTKETYIEQMKMQLDDWNAEIDELEIKAAKATGLARKKCRAEIVKLHRQSHLLADKLDQIKSANEDSWESVVEGVEEMRASVVRSFHYLQSQL
jgi:hypothetical protein